MEVNTNVLGVFALNKGRIIKRIDLPTEPGKLAEKLMEVEKSVCAEEKEMIAYLKSTGTSEIRVRDPDRFSMFRGEIKIDEDRKPATLSEIASQTGVSEQEIAAILSKVSLQITRRKMKWIGRDQVIMQAVSSLDDLEDTSNTLIKRLREWYSLNFPELDAVVKKHDLYTQIVSEGIDVAEEGLRERLHAELDNTMGIKFSESDKRAAKALADSVLGLYATMAKIEAYIGEAMEETAPNITALAGPILGARVMSIAGGLDRMSILPASTIQVLGAEDAFFRFLKTKKDPPKHGVIFQLPEIRSASKKVRGRISRIFAAKLAIAARIDRFHGEYIGEALRADFLKKIANLK
jgi:nucleolar protein 56